MFEIQVIRKEEPRVYRLQRRKKYISVLLTKYSDVTSNMLQIMTRGKYTHASLGITEDEFFSFVTKGFHVERPAKILSRMREDIPCALYRLRVSDDVYEELSWKLHQLSDCGQLYKYSRLGLFLCLLHIPHFMERHYFCSRFVAEILQDCEALKLRKPSSLYLPDDFAKERQLKLCFEGTLKELIASDVKRMNILNDGTRNVWI
ncbi:hypothetical protein [Caproicibacter sp. BJN0012]|uniref:hypothetical protein n=1 Tax=Caproicibacter sp. BJN0012 TaxID=3110227 RepID=UPI002E128820